MWLKNQMKTIKNIDDKKKSSLRTFFSSALVGIIFAGLFSSAVYVLATPPTSKYSPGETLNPDCAVGSTNCAVVAPVPYTGATAALDLGSQNLTTTGTVTVGSVSNNLSAFAATTSAQLAGVISDETGSGVLVFGTSPTLTTPVIGVATGTSVALTNASGAQATFKYDASNYASFTAASNGDLTIATTSGSSGGTITLDTATTGDATILSTNGNIVLGGDGGTNNERLKFDFETTANEAAVSSTTGATNIDFGSLNLETTGTLTLGGSTAGTLVTRVKAGAATESDANGGLVVDSTNGRLYFRYGSAWHYVAQTAGFQIPDFETADPISGEQMKEGDIVLGLINQTFEDKALHGVWVTWNSVKSQLLKDLKEKGVDRLIAEGEQKNNPDPETFFDKVKNGLFSLGISAKNGLTTIKELATDRLTAKVARIEQLEMVDRDTGEVYCTWVGQGEWQKAKGECGSVQVAVTDKQLEQQANEAVQQAVEIAANQAAELAADQAGQQAVQEVKNQIKEEVQVQVKEKVREQLELQEPAPSSSVNLDLPPTDNVLDVIVPQHASIKNKDHPTLPELSSVSEIIPEEPAPIFDGISIQDTASALINGVDIFISITSKKILAGILRASVNFWEKTIYVTLHNQEKIITLTAGLMHSILKNK